MTETKAGYKQQPAFGINDPLLIAWEYFTLLILLSAWKQKHLPPRKAEMILFQVVSEQSFYLLRIPCRLMSKGLLFWLYSQSTHFLPFNCFKTGLMEYGCSRFSFTNNGCSPLCYGFQSLSEFSKFFPAISLKSFITKANNSLIAHPQCHRKSVWLMLKFSSDH